MALSAGAAGAGAGAAMTMNPGMAFGGNAMAAPQAFSSFEPPPSAGPPPGAASMGTGGVQGAGGAYDLRAWEKKDEPDEDLHACLGVDVGTSSIKACLYLKEGGAKAVGGKTPLPAAITVDPKIGVKGVRRWLKQRAGGAVASLAPPKGVTLFNAGNPSAKHPKCSVVWPLRLMALRGKDTEETQRVQSSLRHEVKVSAESSQSAEDAETSGVRLLLTSPDAPEAKDREVWCAPEEVLAMLLAGVKTKTEEAHGVSVKTCNLSAPSCLGDLHRVALQRSVFLAGMVPGRFVGSPLAASVGYLWGRSIAELKDPEDLIMAVSMGASFLDVAVISPSRRSSSSTDEAATDNASSASAAAGATAASAGKKTKKKKAKGGGGGVGGGAPASRCMEYTVKALAGDFACGGLDMDYLVARALLAAVEDSSGSAVASDRSLWRNLLEAACRMRERLSSEPKTSFVLKKGCCDADPSFSHSLELSQKEMEAAIAGTLETLRTTMQTALDRAGVTAGAVKSVVLNGACAATPAMVDSVVGLFQNAEISGAAPGDAAKGASLLLAGSRGLLTGLPVEASDALSHKLGLVDRSKKDTEVIELFAEGTRVPAFSDHDFARKSGSGLAVDIEVVQWVEEGGGVERTGSKKSKGGRWVAVQRLGNPLAMQDDSGYPVLAEEVKMRFSLDECGICVNEVQSSILPQKKPGPGRVRRLLNQAVVALVIFGVLGGGYWMLHRLEHAGERRQAAARIRLTAFYEQHNPEKLNTVEDALARYKGREDVLFQRLKKQYGMDIPR